MEECPNKRLSIENKLFIGSSNTNHHTSLQYKAFFISKNPLFRRGSNSEIIHLENVKKEEIFEMVYRFIGRLVTNSDYLQQIFKDMNYENQDKKISVTNLSDFSSQNQTSSGSLPSGQIMEHSSQKSQKNIKIQMQKKSLQTTKKEKQGARQAKISIMLNSFSDFSIGSGSRISCNSFINISSINFPPHVLTLELIKKIFQEPEPLLINLAVCLMLKFLFYSKMKLTCANACWILSIGTIIAYKIYYDEPVGGLVDSFSDIIQISRSQIMDLQRYFLDQIAFQAIITNQQYHTMLTKIINN